MQNEYGENLNQNKIDVTADMESITPVTNITVDSDIVLNDNFLGLGVQWDPQGDGIPEFNLEQWNMVYRRVDYMQTKFTRVMIVAGCYISTFDNEGNLIYDWNSPQMKRLYKILDYCQKKGVSVMFGEWNKPEWAESYDDYRWINAIGECLQHLYFSKGYSCLKYYNFVNEPNGEWMIPNTTVEQRWGYWSKGVKALYSELKERGFLEWIAICGPDSAYDDDWVDKCVDSMPETIGQYEFHIYKDFDREVLDGSIENLVAEKRDYILKNDSKGMKKHFWLGELGLKEHCDFELDCQDRVYDFDYGVLMADAIVQSIRGGIAGVIPWDLDDAMHFGGGNSSTLGQLKRWGMWNTLGGTTIGKTYYPPNDVELRPWYYTMSLISRLFPKGCNTIHSSVSGKNNLRLTAAKIKNGSKWDLSFLLVNNQDREEQVRITVPKAKGGTSLIKYHYFHKDRPVDKDGFPVIKEVLEKVDLADGLELILQSQGAIFLTSMGTNTPIEL